MKEITLTCKDSSRFFHNCKDCQHYDDCDYPDKKEIKVKRRNFTNKQIQASSVLELIFRMNCLHTMSKRMPKDAGIPYSDIWEATAIIKELRDRLGRIGFFIQEQTNEK